MEGNKYISEKVIKKVYELTIYGFNTVEVTDIMNGKKIKFVIVDKILNTIKNANMYDKEIGKNLENVDLIYEIENNKENLIRVLEEYKELSKKIDSTVKEGLVEKFAFLIKAIKEIKQLEENYDIKTIEIKENKHEPIISEEEFYNVQEKIRQVKDN